MSIIVKISLGSDIRRLTISSASFVEFSELVRKLFADSIPDNFVVKYQDEENDLVTITCDRELAEAIHFASGKLLRLFIVETHPKQASTAAAAPVDEKKAEPETSAPATAGVDALHRIIDQALDCPELRELIGAFGVTPEGIRKIIAGPLDHIHAACNAAYVPEEEKEKEKETTSTTTVPSSAEHNAICDHCDNPIRGIRFKCTHCPDFDLCEQCEKLLPSASVHDTQHLFLKVHTPVRLPCRRQLLPNFYEREAQWGAGGPCRWGAGGPGGPGGCRRRWGGRGPHWRGHWGVAPNGDSNAPTGDTNAPAQTPDAGSGAPECAGAPPAGPGPWCRWRWQRPGAPRWLSSRFIADVTINDGTQMTPRTQFSKVWKLRNTGTSAWPANTSLSFVSGDALGGVQSVSLGETPVEPGAECDVAVDMVAPEKCGRYISNWRLTTPDGIAFGHRVWADIMVVPPPAESEEKQQADEQPIAAEEPKKPEEPVSVPEAVPVLTPAIALVPLSMKEPKKPEEPVSVPEPVLTPAIALVPLSMKKEVKIETPPAPVDPFAEQMAALATMGFSDAEANRRALTKRKGDLIRAIHDLLG